jgi:hypothetical protein
VRKSGTACGLNNYFDGIALRNDLLLSKFRESARAPEAKLIALALACSCNDANDAGNLGWRLIQVDGFERAAR